jgi:hypothetical protein
VYSPRPSSAAIERLRQVFVPPTALLSPVFTRHSTRISQHFPAITLKRDGALDYESALSAPSSHRHNCFYQYPTPLSFLWRRLLHSFLNWAHIVIYTITTFSLTPLMIPTRITPSKVFPSISLSSLPTGRGI